MTIHVISLVGPIYHGETTKENLDKYKYENVPCGMNVIIGDDINDLKNKLCLLLDESLKEAEDKESFKKMSIDLEIEISDLQIINFVKWLKKPNDFSENNFNDIKDYPIRLPILLYLASKNDLPPRTVAEYIEWNKGDHY